jgi:hypothetical protein
MCLLCNSLIRAYFSVYVVLNTDYSVVSDFLEVKTIAR